MYFDKRKRLSETFVETSDAFRHFQSLKCKQIDLIICQKPVKLSVYSKNVRLDFSMEDAGDQFEDDLLKAMQNSLKVNKATIPAVTEPNQAYKGKLF